ncbi:MAG: hypothetical protein ABIJ09_25705 [Pseudomonadota bacterium]
MSGLNLAQVERVVELAHSLARPPAELDAVLLDVARLRDEVDRMALISTDALGTEEPLGALRQALRQAGLGELDNPAADLREIRDSLARLHATLTTIAVTRHPRSPHA